MVGRESQHSGGEGQDQEPSGLVATSCGPRLGSTPLRASLPALAMKAPKRRRPQKRAKRIAILSRKRSLYSTRRLVEAIRAHGHKPIVFDTLRCNLILSKDGPRMVYRGVEVRSLDVVIP